MNILDSGVTLAGTKFTRLAWKNSTTLAMYSATGKEYILNNNPTPLLPLYKLWGSKYNALFRISRRFTPALLPQAPIRSIITITT